MKTTPNRAVKQLRKMIGRTQAEFATMIGASKDTVVSWETGRNQLSPAFARRIAFATGVEGDCLLRNRKALACGFPQARQKVYTAEDFERHRQTVIGCSDEEGARHHLEHCADALELLFLAAAQNGGGKLRYRLPAVLDSFIQWCDRTREDFQLGREIDEQLRKRKAKTVFTLTYREWRAMAKEDPTALKAMGFADDRRKGDEEELSLEIEMAPGWAPGRPMKGPRPLIKEAVLPKR